MEESSLMFMLGACFSGLVFIGIMAIVTRVQFKAHMKYLHKEEVDYLE